MRSIAESWEKRSVDVDIGGEGTRNRLKSINTSSPTNSKRMFISNSNSGGEEEEDLLIPRKKVASCWDVMLKYIFDW